MKTNIAQILFFAVLASFAVSDPAFAAKSAAMEACSKQWDDLKAAGKTEGKTWSSFWSQCSKDFASNGGAAPAPAPEPKKTEKAKKADTVAKNEDDSAGAAQQKKDCDAKWDANKAKTGAHGWHDYFQFMSRCM